LLRITIGVRKVTREEINNIGIYVITNY